VRGKLDGSSRSSSSSRSSRFGFDHTV
jgi:hypothetical protein